ncbi:DUF7501 family protein [Halarchaeum nitratireducens]|uniref:Uncharacterized protein n=1 Tax=Halarchaeum nitratireducens TaxID=489913 RepID=A0A830GAK0_9EURY|nr:MULTISPECIES: hypothetical protein [Halarchaeum]MBP2250564.1 hypothetical protein [Halarchaeum solikamskense]GGN15325.1 hypothetical protein GCM10009021_14570 [Halarchaeum nitratireducens]
MTDADPTDVDWEDPERCPWCGAAVRDGGAGFIEHVEEHPDCAAAFETWRENIADDIGGEWTS